METLETIVKPAGPSPAAARRTATGGGIAVATRVAASAIAVVLLCAGPSARAAIAQPLASAPPVQKQVLVIYSTRRDAQVAVVGDRELPRVLEQGLPQGLDFYSEYIDLMRSPAARYQRSFRDFLRVKYAGVRLDLVIAVQDTALAFLRNYGEELFPKTPVVFLSTDPETPGIRGGTGLVAPVSLLPTIELAAALRPDLEQVFVVTGSSETDGEYERLARTQLAPLTQRFAVTYLAGLSMLELEARVGSLPARSMVLFVMFYRDRLGENFHPLASLDRVTRAANAPVYTWVDSGMDRGIVGGYLKDQLVQTKAIGALALRVLRGESVDTIPIYAPSVHVSQVDWRQLRRWGVREDLVPAGTLIRFRAPSLWDQYRVYILGAAAVVLAQTVLIVGLLVQRTRRREAEDRLRSGQAELRTSHNRIRDLGARLLQAQEGERARIARELHDDISQQVALLQIDLELLGGTVDRHAEGMVADALDRTHGLARSLHDLSHRLHPAKLRLIGLVSAVRGLAREFDASDVHVGVTVENVPAALPPELTLCLFRTVQEGLQNAVKYSRARQIRVRLIGGNGALALTIEDDGVGFDVGEAWGRGLGLVSMKERLESVGGTFAISSRPGAGTRIEARAPLAAATDDPGAMADTA